jgi:hypothetical protein
VSQAAIYSILHFECPHSSNVLTDIIFVTILSTFFQHFFSMKFMISQIVDGIYVFAISQNLSVGLQILFAGDVAALFAVQMACCCLLVHWETTSFQTWDQPVCFDAI